LVTSSLLIHAATTYPSCHTDIVAVLESDITLIIFTETNVVT
jgi:hypothetical protein